MISMTLTQQMGTQPVAARGRGAVAGVFAFCPAHRPAAAHPYADTPATGLNRNGNGALVSGFWVADSMVATTRTIKRLTRPLVPRTT
jgi:hypothetical protein